MAPRIRFEQRHRHSVCLRCCVWWNKRLRSNAALLLLTFPRPPPPFPLSLLPSFPLSLTHSHSLFVSLLNASFAADLLRIHACVLRSVRDVSPQRSLHQNWTTTTPNFAAPVLHLLHSTKSACFPFSSLALACLAFPHIPSDLTPAPFLSLSLVPADGSPRR